MPGRETFAAGLLAVIGFGQTKPRMLIERRLAKLPSLRWMSYPQTS